MDTMLESKKADFLRDVHRVRSIAEKHAKILDECRGERVLDVGCVGQARGPDSNDWLHALISDVATSVVGVDVDEEGVVRLIADGWDIVTPDELEERGERYDVVVMGDVIEHVDSTIEFLRYYADFLEGGGRIVITTPNPFSVLQFFHILIRNEPAVNPEHTLWLEPYTIAEVAARTGLDIIEFSWLTEEYDVAALSLKERVIHGVAHAARRVRPYLAPSFLCIMTPVDAH